MQDELDENQNKTDEELKRLGFGLLVPKVMCRFDPLSVWLRKLYQNNLLVLDDFFDEKFSSGSKLYFPVDQSLHTLFSKIKKRKKVTKGS